MHFGYLELEGMNRKHTPRQYICFVLGCLRGWENRDLMAAQRESTQFPPFQRQNPQREPRKVRIDWPHLLPEIEKGRSLCWPMTQSQKILCPSRHDSPIPLLRSQFPNQMNQSHTDDCFDWRQLTEGRYKVNHPADPILLHSSVPRSHKRNTVCSRERPREERERARKRRD